MKIQVRISLVALAALMALLLSACGGAGPEPTATPTKTPLAAAEQPADATPTPAPAAGQPAAEQSATGTQPEQPTAAAQPETATVTADQLNVRSEPSTAGNIVRMVTAGQSFTVAGRSSDGAWVQVAENGQPIGWVSAEFVQIAGGASAGGEQTADAGAGQPAPAQPAPVGSGSYAPATMSSPDFGGQAFLWWKPEVADRDLKLMNEGGFNWVKQTFAWETIEGAGKGQFDWSISDRVVTHVNNEGLKLLARLSSDPNLKDKFWGGKPPANTQNFADFAYAVASRYNCTPQAVGCIQAFQVWNEPNLGREWGGNRPNPAEYSEMLRQVYAAIKRGNPNAIVITAGMAPTGDNSEVAMPDDLYYEGMYQAMGGNSDGYFDMLGVHGAGFAAPPELDPAEAASNPKYGGYRFFAFRHVEDIRAIMEKYGDSDKKIVLLEFGWTYDRVNPAYRWHGADAGIDEMVQADYLKRAYQYAAANWQPWIGLMSLLTMPNLDWTADGNPQDEEQYWWAIMEPSDVDELHFRPAYIVLCDYFNELSGQRCIYAPE